MAEIVRNDSTQEETTRNDLLRELHNITCAVFMTDLVSEYCFEITVLTSVGVLYRWIGYTEWTVYKLKLCTENQWTMIRMKTQNGTLTRTDLIGTQFDNLLNATIEHNDNLDYSVLLSGLLNVPQQGQNELYCYYDPYECSFTFAADQDELKKILSNIYVADSSWEDMDTEELAGWLKKYKEEGQGIPCTYFEEE